MQGLKGTKTPRPNPLPYIYPKGLNLKEWSG